MTRPENRRRGELQHCAKLTPDGVREIMASKETCAVLAARLGCSPVAVHKVRVGKSWTHITGLFPLRPYESVTELRAEGII